MNLLQLQEFLPKRLQLPLPGEDIQRNMMAIPDSKLRFDTASRENARHSGVLILFYEEEGEVKIPLILRHDYGGAHSGQVSLPGGRVEPEDQTIIDTALRETEEEIGVPRKDIEVLGELTELFIPVSNFLVFPVVGIIHNIPEFVPEEREVDQILHPPLLHLLDPNRLKKRELIVKGYTLQTPYFDLEGQVVWGATAMMLSELRHILIENQ